MAILNIQKVGLPSSNGAVIVRLLARSCVCQSVTVSSMGGCLMAIQWIVFISYLRRSLPINSQMVCWVGQTSCVSLCAALRDDSYYSLSKAKRTRHTGKYPRIWRLHVEVTERTDIFAR